LLDSCLTCFAKHVNALMLAVTLNWERSCSLNVVEGDEAAAEALVGKIEVFASVVSALGQLKYAFEGENLRCFQSDCMGYVYLIAVVLKVHKAGPGPGAVRSLITRKEPRYSDRTRCIETIVKDCQAVLDDISGGLNNSER